MLRNTNKNDKKEIILNFDPFVNHKSYDGIIIGNDLDSIISSCLLKEKFNWDIVGIYDYNNIWYDLRNDLFYKNLLSGRYVCIDLDIYHENIFSLGHHILAYKPADELPKHIKSLNPNLIRGFNVSEQNSYMRKYPLSTIHFLIWLFDANYSNRLCELLIWLADSTFINGQTGKYRENMKDWLLNFLNSSFMYETFTQIDNMEYELEIQKKLLPILRTNPLCSNSGRAKSRHLHLGGYQFQWHDPIKEYIHIKDIFKLVSSITEWAPPDMPREFLKIQGIREKKKTNIFLSIDLDHFLNYENVFSYVFDFKDSINYTKFLKWI